MQTKEQARAKLISKIATMDDALIVECCRQIGGGNVDEEHRMVRAYMLDEFEKRYGGEAVEELMDCLGM